MSSQTSKQISTFIDVYFDEKDKNIYPNSFPNNFTNNENRDGHWIDSALFEKIQKYTDINLSLKNKYYHRKHGTEKELEQILQPYFPNMVGVYFKNCAENTKNTGDLTRWRRTVNFTTIVHDNKSVWAILFVSNKKYIPDFEIDFITKSTSVYGDENVKNRFEFCMEDLNV